MNTVPYPSLLKIGANKSDCNCIMIQHAATSQLKRVLQPQKFSWDPKKSLDPQ